jgi:glycosyltransferase involved in cell wall biosynthesis
MSYSYKKIGIQHSSILDIQDGELKKILRNLLYKRIVKNYNYLLGVSEKTIEPLKKYKNVYLLRNGIDTKEFKPINSDFKTKLKLSYGYKSHEKLIIMVGALNNNKGQLEALKVIKKLGPEYRLILVGNGPLEIEIKNEIEFNKISDKVKMLGHIKNVVNYYQISDILLFLSINEGLPLTILEAMATGLPIITTKVGGVPEVVRDKENGFFINRNYLDEAEFIIQDLLNSPIKIKQIEENNIKKIKKNYSLEKCVEGLIGYIEKLQ